MKYEFSFYRDEDYEELIHLCMLSYQWEYPVVGLGRIEFVRGLKNSFEENQNAWYQTVGMYRENGKVVACVWNEGDYQGDLYFMFDKKERGEDIELLADMIKFTKTYAAALQEDGRTRRVNLFISSWHETLKKYVLEHGFMKDGYEDSCYVLPFAGEKLEVNLPEGYRIVDGNETPDFYLASIHRLSFASDRNENFLTNGTKLFSNVRKMEYYDKNLDLCILDQENRPVAMAIIWYNENMPYCELEPLCVGWWERRKGLGTAIIHEAANRVMERYPNCKGMRGGDQEFYSRIGFKKMDAREMYIWETEIIISWEKESFLKDYTKEVE